MKKILLMFATRQGQTEKVAGRIAEHLERGGADVRLVDAADAATTDIPDPDRFDLLAFGASMHAGGLEKELVDFVNGHADAIRRRPRAFFLVLLSAATKDPQLRAEWLSDARAKMRAQLEVDFGEPEMIAGALAYSRYSPPVRWLMKRIAGKAGGDTDTSRDYEYTDWQQVERFARGLLDRSDVGR